MTPKTLAEMAEEYQSSMGHECGMYHGDIASAFLAGARATANHPDVKGMREALTFYADKRTMTGPLMAGEALAAFDRLMSEVK